MLGGARSCHLWLLGAVLLSSARAGADELRDWGLFGAPQWSAPELRLERELLELACIDEPGRKCLLEAHYSIHNTGLEPRRVDSGFYVHGDSMEEPLSVELDGEPLRYSPPLPSPPVFRSWPQPDPRVYSSYAGFEVAAGQRREVEVRGWEAPGSNR